jgi:hypothetical protein
MSGRGVGKKHHVSRKANATPKEDIQFLWRSTFRCYFALQGQDEVVATWKKHFRTATAEKGHAGRLLISRAALDHLAVLFFQDFMSGRRS